MRAALDAGQGLSEALPAIRAAMAPQAPGWAGFEATTARNAAACARARPGALPHMPS